MSPSTIRHCSFVSPTDHDTSDDTDIHPDTDTAETADLLARVETNVTMNDYVSVDQEAITSESLTDDLIVESVKFSSKSLAGCEDVDSEEPHPLVTAKEAQRALKTLQLFLEQQQEADFNLFVKFDNHITSFFSHHNIKQMLTDYASTSTRSCQ